MSLFTWNSMYATGIPTIDNQHKKLVELLNALFDGMKSGQGDQAAGKTLDELIKYTITHFSTEEQLFKKYGYPETEAHKKEHENLKTQALKLQSDYRSGKAQITMDVANFLRDWLKNHILQTDKKYAPFLIAKGAK